LPKPAAGATTRIAQKRTSTVTLPALQSKDDLSSGFNSLQSGHRGSLPDDPVILARNWWRGAVPSLNLQGSRVDWRSMGEFEEHPRTTHGMQASIRIANDLSLSRPPSRKACPRRLDERAATACHGRDFLRRQSDTTPERYPYLRVTLSKYVDMLLNAIGAQTPVAADGDGKRIAIERFSVDGMRSCGCVRTSGRTDAPDAQPRH
jgi:hypothetical protein